MATTDPTIQHPTPPVPATPAPAPHDVFTIDDCAGICVVTVHAQELTCHIAEILCTALLDLIDNGRRTRFVLDFDRVRFMESLCFGALVTFLRALARYEGKIAIANVHENVRFLFAVTKLDRVFTLSTDVPTAMLQV